MTSCHLVMITNREPPPGKSKSLPKGVTPHLAYTFPEKYGGMNYLQPIEIGIVEGLMKDIGGGELVEFVPPAYAAKAIEPWPW